MAVKTKVVQDPDKPVAVEIIAQSIVDISKAMKQIGNSRLEERAVVLLIHDLSGVSMGDIKKVLRAGRDLEIMFTKKLKK